MIVPHDGRSFPGTKHEIAFVAVVAKVIKVQLCAAISEILLKQRYNHSAISKTLVNYSPGVSPVFFNLMKDFLDTAMQD